jgi:glutamine synthetase
VSWARNNRSGLIRVPIAKRGNPMATRIEYRSPDPACNPYLAFAVVLAAGLRGIEKDYELVPETEDNIYEMTDMERRAAGITGLPRNLDEALGVMEESELVAEALGEHVFEYFLRNKRVEWDEYRAQVTPYELRKYLPTL